MRSNKNLPVFFLWQNCTDPRSVHSEYYVTPSSKQEGSSINLSKINWLWVLTFLTSGCVIRCWTGSNRRWTTGLSPPVEVVLLRVVPVAEVLLEIAVPFGWWQRCGWGWGGGERCWPAGSVEAPGNVRNRAIPAATARLALSWRDSNVATVLPGQI